MVATASTVSREQLLSLYETMVLIRQAELRISKLFSDGQIPGSVHVCVGQEAVSAGVMSVLSPGDTITSTHRGHGHAIARGADLGRLFKEIMGRSGGLCGGRGGSMHVADLSLGILGANGIVGGGIPIALGSALAHRVRGTGGIAVGLFGDGARGEGIFYETLNLAALWDLPLLLVCENNRWAEFSPSAKYYAADFRKLVQSFGLKFAQVDGNDAVAVAKEALSAVEGLRNGGRPFVLECLTLRLRGHYEGDPQKYRDMKELSGIEANDPIARVADRLRRLADGDAGMRAVDERAASRVAEAVRQAAEDVEPAFGDALRDVYTAAPEA